MGGVEKGVDLLLRTGLARRTSMRLFNTYRSHDPSRPGLEKLRFQARIVRSFRDDLRRDAPDLIHVKTSSGVNFYQNSLYCLEARLRSLPVLLQIHSGRFEAFFWSSILPLRAWIRHTLQSVDRVVVLSEYWRERLQHIAPAACVSVVPNGLSEEEISRLRIAPGESRVSQVFFLGTGRRDLNRDKGLDDLTAVLPRLARRHPTTRWVIAGLEDPDGFRRSFGAELLSAGSSLQRVVCLGTIDTRQRIALLRESTILALPSYFENMPNLLLEGMAAGMGVVATRVGAIPEMLDSGRGGLVIPPGDREALARSLDRLLDDPPLVRRQGRHNEARVAAHYTMSVVERRFEDLYGEVSQDHDVVTWPGGRPRGSEVGAEVPLPGSAALGAGRAQVAAAGPVGGRPIRSAAWALAREAVRLSAGLLTPGKMAVVSSPDAPGTDLPFVSDFNLPESGSFLRFPPRRLDATFHPPGPLPPPAGPPEPGSVLLGTDCPIPRKQVD